MYNEMKHGPVYTERGASIEDIKYKLHKEYGECYEILSIKDDLTDGFLGFGKKPCKKVTYIITERTPYPSKSSSTRTSGAQTLQGNVYRTSPYVNPPSSTDAFLKNRDEFLKKNNGDVTQTIQIAHIVKEIQELKTEVKDSISKITETSVNQGIHSTITKMETLLEQNEFTPSYIRMISEKIKSTFSLEELEDEEKVEKAVVDWIGESIHVAEEPHFRPPHVIIIIGPTGVGKTTTVAKLAANTILEARNNSRPEPVVKMITVDRMRVGAAEQLEKYGEIMNVSVDKAEKSEDLKSLFNSYKSTADTLLIDTSGYSPNDYENIAKLRALLDVQGIVADVYLAVTAGTKARDLEIILRNYESFAFRSLIITKCDETSSYGNILSVLHEKNKSISLITNGQQVPRFIEKASVTKFLMGLEGFQIDRNHIETKFGKAQVK